MGGVLGASLHNGGRPGHAPGVIERPGSTSGGGGCQARVSATGGVVEEGKGSALDPRGPAAPDPDKVRRISSLLTVVCRFGVLQKGRSRTVDG